MRYIRESVILGYCPICPLSLLSVDMHVVGGRVEDIVPPALPASLDGLGLLFQEMERLPLALYKSR